MSKKKAAVKAVEKENPGPGRPSLYHPDYCQKLVAHMAKGYSYETFAATIKVNRDTLYEWEKHHEDWVTAKKCAVDANLLHWEGLALDNMFNTSDWIGDSGNSKALNGTIWIFNMKNRHKWRDKQPDEADSVNVNVSLADRMAKARARVTKK